MSACPLVPQSLKEPLKEPLKSPDCSGKGSYIPGPGWALQEQRNVEFGCGGSDNYISGPVLASPITPESPSIGPVCMSQYVPTNSYSNHHFYGRVPTPSMTGYTSYASMY